MQKQELQKFLEPDMSVKGMNMKRFWTCKSQALISCVNALHMNIHKLKQTTSSSEE